MVDLGILGHFVTWGFLLAILFFLRAGVRGAGLPRAPKPPKKYVCPHGKITTQKEHIIKGQKRVLCDYCYNKELEAAIEELPPKL